MYYYVYYFLIGSFQKPAIIQALTTQTERKKNAVKQTREPFQISACFLNSTRLSLCLNLAQWGSARFRNTPFVGVSVKPQQRAAGARRPLRRGAPDPQGRAGAPGYSGRATQTLMKTPHFQETFLMWKVGRFICPWLRGRPCLHFTLIKASNFFIFAPLGRL